MLGWLIDNNVPTVKGAFGESNWKKWTLQALLFGLRIREVIPDFILLSSRSERERNLATKIRAQIHHQEILNTPIPKLALKNLDAGPNPPTLGALVLKFLEAKADETDLKLAGGIGLAS